MINCVFEQKLSVVRFPPRDIFSLFDSEWTTKLMTISHRQITNKSLKNIVLSLESHEMQLSVCKFCPQLWDTLQKMGTYLTQIVVLFRQLVAIVCPNHFAKRAQSSVSQIIFLNHVRQKNLRKNVSGRQDWTLDQFSWQSSAAWTICRFVASYKVQSSNSETSAVKTQNFLEKMAKIGFNTTLFPGGPPPQYWAGSNRVNFGVRMRIGALRLIWSNPFQCHLIFVFIEIEIFCVCIQSTVSRIKFGW